MLRILRKKGVMKKLLWFVAVIIILSFGILGQAYLLNDTGKTSYAGKIFGKKISIDEFNRNLDQVSINAFVQYGENFGKLKPYLNLESKTWDRLILLHEINKRNFHVPDEQLVETIQGFPFFHKKGVFDKNLYEIILNQYFKIKPRDFEEGTRGSLKIAYLFEAETTDITIPEKEILDAYKIKNEKIQVSYVLLESDQFKNQVTFDEIKAKEYYMSHKNEFLLPPMFNMEYLKIDIPIENEEKDKENAEETAFEIYSLYWFQQSQ